MRISRPLCVTLASLAMVSFGYEVHAQEKPRPYRLESVDLKQRVIWGGEVREPEGQGLAFGGQDQDAADGRPHTRIFAGGKWNSIHEELREKNPLQALQGRTKQLSTDVKHALARARFVYFKGLPADGESAMLKKEVVPRLAMIDNGLEKLLAELPDATKDDYDAGQIRFAMGKIKAARAALPALEATVSREALRKLHAAQIQLELAAEAFDAEPPPRALDCGKARKQEGTSDPPAQAIAYDAKTKLYVLFGGDHLDYLTNDTWVFDPAKRQWQQRHPQAAADRRRFPQGAAPPPRANHRLEAAGDGKVRLTGGYTYTSNTDYVGGQYADLDDGAWVYDVEKNTWTPVGGNQSQLVAADSRVYRSGPFHPEFYLQGEKPNAAAFEAWLEKLPANAWIATDPPLRPRLNRDWGTARIDPDRDIILRWSGGHSAHGGSDVPHFHFSTNRWELPFPVEFPLGQLYSNTSYPNGYNFNLRPWITGHTYQNYDYDPPSKKMIKAGRPRHFYIYDPEVADWISRGEKPAAMQYNSCFYTLTLAATPHGVVCWDKDGRVHRYQHRRAQWIELDTTGDKLPGAYVDNSSIVYDSKRDRVLMIDTLGYGKPFDGQVWALDLKTNVVKALSPAGMEHADRFANVDKSCYDAANDLLLLGTFLKNAGDHTPTPAYDCAGNRWVLLDLKYETGKRFNNTTRAFPQNRSDGMMFDPQRKLIWGTDTNSQVWVLKLTAEKANVRPLK